MRWEVWIFSAKLAWRRSFMRWLTVGSFSLGMIGIGLFFWRVLPEVRQTGTAVIHYNIYFGIDAIQPWPWMFLWPAVWVFLAFVGWVIAFVSYQQDRVFAQSLTVVVGAWTLAWLFALFYLSLVNVV